MATLIRLCAGDDGPVVINYLSNRTISGPGGPCWAGGLGMMSHAINLFQPFRLPPGQEMGATSGGETAGAQAVRCFLIPRQARQRRGLFYFPIPVPWPHSGIGGAGVAARSSCSLWRRPGRGRYQGVIPVALHREVVAQTQPVSSPLDVVPTVFTISAAQRPNTVSRGAGAARNQGAGLLWTLGPFCLEAEPAK